MALVTVQWAYYARTVRSSAIVERQKEYVEAARVLALSPWKLLPRGDDTTRRQLQAALDDWDGPTGELYRALALATTALANEAKGNR